MPHVMSPNADLRHASAADGAEEEEEEEEGGRGRGLKKQIIHSGGNDVAGMSSERSRRCAKRERRCAKRELPAIRMLALGGADVLSQV